MPLYVVFLFFLKKNKNGKLFVCCCRRFLVQTKYTVELTVHSILLINKNLK